MLISISLMVSTQKAKQNQLGLFEVHHEGLYRTAVRHVLEKLFPD